MIHSGNFSHGWCHHPLQSMPGSMIRLFQTCCLAPEVSSRHRKHRDFPRGGGNGGALTAWVCSSNSAVSARSGWCDLSQCVWKNQPGSKQNEPLCLMLETSNYLGIEDLRVGCGTLWGSHFTSRASWQEVERYHQHGPRLTYGLGFYAKWLLFSQSSGCGNSSTSSHLSTLPLSVTSEF